MKVRQQRYKKTRTDTLYFLWRRARDVLPVRSMAGPGLVYPKARGTAPSRRAKTSSKANFRCNFDHYPRRFKAFWWYQVSLSMVRTSADGEAGFSIGRKSYLILPKKERRKGGETTNRIPLNASLLTIVSVFHFQCAVKWMR